MSPFRLAVITPYVGATTETFIRRHVRDLLPDSVVITGTDAHTYGEDWRPRGPVLHVPLDRGGRRWRAALRRASRREPEHLRRARAFLETHGVAAVLAEYLDSSLDWLGLADDPKLRFVVHAHGYDVSELLRSREWRRRYLRYAGAHAVVTPSEHARSRLIDCGLPASKVHAIACGVPVPARFPEPIEGASIRCLAVGRMVAKKAPLTTLAAFARAAVKEPRLRLDFVGAGPLEAMARSFVTAHGLGSVVTLHGRQPNEVVQDLLLRCHIFLQHSVTDAETGDEEGLPVGILEAMAVGRPVVATRHAGIPEAVDDGRTGILVEEHDVGAMADAVVHLAESAALRLTMGRQAWLEASRSFSWDRERRGLLALLGLDSDD